MACMKSSGASAKNFMQPAYSISHKGGKSLLIVETVETKFNFVKDMPMIYVNFIKIVITVYDQN
jgi:hypothetical protein